METKKGFEWVIRVTCFFCGMVVCLVLALLIQTYQLPVSMPTSMNGIFFGQVIDAISLKPIYNATVYLCTSNSFNSLATTVVTNNSGYYKTTNITLPLEFYVCARATNYYTQPLSNAHVELDGIDEQRAYISPIKLYKISHKIKIYCQFFGIPGDPLHSEAFVINSTTVITLNNQSLLPFAVMILNKDSDTAAGSPYFGDLVSIHVNPNRKVVCIPDQTHVNSVINAYAYDPSVHVGVVLKFTEEGLYTVSINFLEKPYPAVYQEPLHAYASISFQVNWVGS